MLPNHLVGMGDNRPALVKINLHRNSTLAALDHHGRLAIPAIHPFNGMNGSGFAISDRDHHAWPQVANMKKFRAIESARSKKVWHLATLPQAPTRAKMAIPGI